MKRTPEGLVKAAIDKALKHASLCYVHKPVQNGMGMPTLDYIGCCRGRYFAIEAKAPGKLPTLRQELTMRAIEDAGGRVFVVDEVSGPKMNKLWDWLHLG